MTNDHLTLDQADRLAAGLPEQEEPFLAGFCREFAVSESEALEMLAYAEQSTPKPVGGDLHALRKLEAHFRNALHILIDYQTKQTSPSELRAATRVMALELGFLPQAGADNIAELAKICLCDKQRLNKCSQNFQRRLRLPPRDGQRTREARKQMSRARNRKLK